MESGKRLQSKVTGGHQSPERSRRKDKFETERQEVLPPVTENEGNTRRRRLQDPVALEDVNADDKSESGNGGERLAKRGRREAPDYGRDPEYVPKSGYFYEHDDRTSSWRPRANPKRRPFDGGRPENPRPLRKNEDRWNGSLQHDNNNNNNNNHTESSDRWRHDGYYQIENGGVRRGSFGRNRGGRGGPGNSRFHDRWLGGGFSRRPGFNRSAHNSDVVDGGRWGDDNNNINVAVDRGRSRHSMVSRGGAAGGRFRRPFVSRANLPSAAASAAAAAPSTEWKHDLFDDTVPASKQEEDSVARAEALLAA